MLFQTIMTLITYQKANSMVKSNGLNASRQF